MAARQQNIQLPTSEFKGLVLNPSIVNRDFNTANLCSNVVKKKNGQLTVRPSTQLIIRRRDAVGAGNNLFWTPFTYTYYNTDNGATESEIVALQLETDRTTDVQQNPTFLRLNKESTVISYTGTGNGVISITANTALVSNNIVWKVEVTANNVVVYSATYQAAASLSVAGEPLEDFLNAIDALADFSVSSNLSTKLARYTFIDAFDLPVTWTIASGGSQTLYYYEPETINTTTDLAPLRFGDAGFILPSALNYSNVLYVAYGTYEYKYDGVDFYRSGLPQATISAIADSAGGTTHALGNTYIYKLVYSRVDAKGNINDGEDSDDTLAVATHTMVATRDIDLTVNNLSAASYPNYALKGAKVNGAQAGVTTITVDSGHTLEIGDTAYFYDGVSASYVTREVTNTAATTITIAGAAVNVADNIQISNNVRIQIWRTKNDGTDFYFVDEIPNDPFNATQVYLDDVADTALTELYVEQIRKHNPPPKCSFLIEHQGLKVSAGDPDYPNRVTWTLPDAAEAYPLASNLTDIKGAGLGALTAIAKLTDEKLAAFKFTGHAVLDGYLDDLTFSVKDKSNTGIGCSSFRSLAYIGNADSLIGLCQNGVFLYNGTDLDLAISFPIRAYFDDKPLPQITGETYPYATAVTDVVNNVTLNKPLNTTRAVALNDNVGRKYHLFIPLEVGIIGEYKAPAPYDSKYLVFDYDADIQYWTEYTFYEKYRTTDDNCLIANRRYNPPLPYCGFFIYENEVWYADLQGINFANTIPLVYKYRQQEDDQTIEACYPVYLDIHYTPFTREVNKAVAFFKPLYVKIYKFLSDFLTDPSRDEGLGSAFSITVRTIKDFKRYASSLFSLNSTKTFNVDLGLSELPFKAPTTKCRAYQIQISNGSADPNNYTPPLIDSVELLYNAPYDNQSKETKGDG